MIRLQMGLLPRWSDSLSWVDMTWRGVILGLSFYPLADSHIEPWDYIGGPTRASTLWFSHLNAL
jgi:hypothetical protein